jgi:hypothetical protein
VPPAERKQIQLQQFTGDLKQASIAGIGYDIGTIEDFASRLRQNPCFKKVDLKETRKTTRHPDRPSWLEFTLKLEVKCDLKSGTTAPSTASSGTTPDKTDKPEKPSRGDKPTPTTKKTPEVPAAPGAGED